MQMKCLLYENLRRGRRFYASYYKQIRHYIYRRVAGEFSQSRRLTTMLCNGIRMNERFCTSPNAQVSCNGESMILFKRVTKLLNKIYPLC